jgi:hypothetical protein
MHPLCCWVQHIMLPCSIRCLVSGAAFANWPSSGVGPGAATAKPTKVATSNSRSARQRPANGPASEGLRVETDGQGAAQSGRGLAFD